MKKHKCELCKGTGWYGDNGPGIRGNTEYVPCEKCRGTSNDNEIVERKISILMKENDSLKRLLQTFLDYYPQGTNPQLDQLVKDIFQKCSQHP